MSLPPDGVDEGIMFSICPPATFVHSSVCLSGQILLLRYLMNGLSNLVETYREKVLFPIDELIRFGGRRSKVKVTAGRRGGEGVHVDGGASKSIVYYSVMVRCGGLSWPQLGRQLFSGVSCRVVSYNTSITERRRCFVRPAAISTPTCSRSSLGRLFNEAGGLITTNLHCPCLPPINTRSLMWLLIASWSSATCLTL